MKITRSLNIEEICKDDYPSRELLDDCFTGNYAALKQLKEMSLDKSEIEGIIQGVLCPHISIPLASVEVCKDAEGLYRILHGKEEMAAYAYVGMKEVPVLVHDFKSPESPAYIRKRRNLS
jgi:hypothetical protein